MQVSAQAVPTVPSANRARRLESKILEGCAVLDIKPAAGDSKVAVTSTGVGMMPELAVEVCVRKCARSDFLILGAREAVEPESQGNGEERELTVAARICACKCRVRAVRACWAGSHRPDIL